MRLDVRVTPKAGADRIEGIHTDAAGAVRLIVRVRAAPDRGAANAAVAALLAKALQVPKGAVSLVSGATSRQKTFDCAGDAEELARRLQDLVKT